MPNNQYECKYLNVIKNELKFKKKLWNKIVIMRLEDYKQIPTALIQTVFSDMGLINKIKLKKYGYVFWL